MVFITVTKHVYCIIVWNYGENVKRIAMKMAHYNAYTCVKFHIMRLITINMSLTDYRVYLQKNTNYAPHVLFVAEGCEVKLVPNINVAAGLVNSITGKVIKIVYNNADVKDFIGRSTSCSLLHNSRFC